MKTLILNWKAGENDPFTVLNAAIGQHFRACGKDVAVVEITNDDWVTKVAQFAVHGIDFVFTWQGLGSGLRVNMGKGDENLWDVLRVPLICLHGDHPVHCPANHLLESRYCFHVYCDAEFARYSNRHLRRVRSAGVVDLPRLHSEPRLRRATDECFVVIKNITDPLEIERSWHRNLERPLFEAHMMAAETLKERLADDRYVDVHAVLDQLIDGLALERLRPEADAGLFHEFHSQLDFYARNHKSVATLSSLREFPVHVYGRGWDRIKGNAAKSHVFHDGLDTADSQRLYYTRFGLVDISPARVLHDRTHRAMVNGCPFLSSANIDGLLADIEPYAPLFFSFRADELATKCAAVVGDPEAHRDLAQRFAHAYYDRFDGRVFVDKLDALARTVDRF